MCHYVLLLSLWTMNSGGVAQSLPKVSASQPKRTTTLPPPTPPTRLRRACNLVLSQCNCRMCTYIVDITMDVTFMQCTACMPVDEFDIYIVVCHAANHNVHTDCVFIHFIDYSQLLCLNTIAMINCFSFSVPLCDCVGPQSRCCSCVLPVSQQRPINLLHVSQQSHHCKNTTTSSTK